MAKWGEGDPRWIVEERPDATNVNNWHWTEKNADQWSKTKLNALLVNFEILDDKSKGKVIFEEMEKCEGEARANNRKAKLIFFYEWEIVLKWKCQLPDDDDVTGKVTIPNLSEEHEDLNDVDLEVTLTSTSSKTAEQIKDMLRKGQGAKAIRDQLRKYVEALKSEFSAGLILPKTNEGQAKAKTTTVPTKVTSNHTSINNQSASSAMKNLDLGKGGKVNVGKIEFTERFKCTGQELYNVLTQKEMIQVFTCSEVKMLEAKNGAGFELLGGNIQGRYESLTPFTKIQQKWRLKTWPEGHFSDVEFTITQKSEDTELKLVQVNVPSTEIDQTRSGWSRYYFEAIRRNFGFGTASL